RLFRTFGSERKELIVLLFCSSILNAQTDPYRFTGIISGTNSYKFAVLKLPDINYTEAKVLTDNKFEFTGNFFAYIPRFGNLPIWNIILTNDTNHIIDTDPQIQFVMEPQVVINYNSDSGLFDVSGGPMNQVKNAFRANELQYNVQQDSVIRLIKNNSSDPEIIKKLKRKISSLNVAKIKNKSEIIKQNPNSEVSLNEFSAFAVFPYYSREQTRELFMIFPEKIRRTRYGKRLDSIYNDTFNKLVKPNMLGKQFPKFELPNEKDVKIKGLSIASKYTLIDFWASWCMPCRAEYPFIKTAYERYKIKGFKVITISIDKSTDKDKWQAAILKDGLSGFDNLFCPSLEAGTSGIAKELNINAIPSNYLLNEKRVIVATDLRGKDLEEKLKSLMP
ncbi:MAG: TlpA family protein disulfide reductase, partial [Pedobacter sp.]